MTPSWIQEQNLRSLIKVFVFQYLFKVLYFWSYRWQKYRIFNSCYSLGRLTNLLYSVISIWVPFFNASVIIRNVLILVARSIVINEKGWNYNFLSFLWFFLKLFYLFYSNMVSVRRKIKFISLTRKKILLQRQNLYRALSFRELSLLKSVGVACVGVLKVHNNRKYCVYTINPLHILKQQHF